MKRVGNSFKGVIGGFICIIIGVVLLWWNEGNNVRNLKTTAEMEKTYIDVKSDTVDSKNEGKLVATSGSLINEKELTDETFGITVKTPVLKRNVEMYQWDEDSRTDEDGNTIYSYNKEWSDDVIDSSRFNQAGHENPSYKPYEDEIYTSDDVKVGAFSLSTKQIYSLSTNGSYTDFNQEKIASLNMYVSGNYVTNSGDLNNPNIGDVRISFNYNNSSEVSILAVQKGNSFDDFTSSAGKTINRVMDGSHTGAEMIETIKAENKLLKWILRLVGVILCIAGFGAILKPLSAITSFIPILGNVVGLAVGLVSIGLGLALSLIVIAIAWIRFRPLVGIGLLAGALIILVLIITKGKKSKSETLQQPVQDIQQPVQNVQQPMQGIQQPVQGVQQPVVPQATDVQQPVQPQQSDTSNPLNDMYNNNQQ